MPTLQELIELAQELTFRDQAVLTKHEQARANGGFAFNRFHALTSEVKRFLLLSSLPYVIGEQRDHSWGRLWDANKCFSCTSLINYQRTLPTGNLEPVYFVVGDAPSAAKIEHFEPVRAFSADTVVRKALAKAGIYYQCWFTHVLKDAMPGNAPSAQEVRSECNEFLAYEIKTLKPRYILAIGEHVRKVCHFKGKIIEISEPGNFNNSDGYARHIKERIKDNG